MCFVRLDANLTFPAECVQPGFLGDVTCGTVSQHTFEACDYYSNANVISASS